MANYIDREAAAESLNAMKPFLRDQGQVRLLRRTMLHIGKIPAADVAPVVRCKDCMHKGTDSWCDYVEDDNFFCARGERKEADGNG